MKRPLLNLIKITFLILGSLLLTPQVFSQDTVIESGDHSEAVVNEALKDTNAVEKKDPAIPTATPSSAPTPTPAPNIAPTEELTKADELSAMLQKGTGKTKLKIGNANSDPTDEMRNELENFLRQVNKLPAKRQPFHQLVALTLDEVKKVPDAEIEKNLFLKIENQNVKDFLAENPKAKIYVKELIKEKNALVELSKIFDDFNVIVKFLTVMVLTFLVGFALDRFFKYDKRSTFGRVNVFIFKIIFMMGVRLGVIYFFFGENLRPAIELALKVYKS